MKVGVLGGGQLARMLALAGYPLGIRIICLDPTENPCAEDVTEVIKAEYHDKDALTKLAQAVDCFTFENENIPLDTACMIEQLCPVYPPIKALKITQDRLFEKQLFNQLGIATPLYFPIQSYQDLEAAFQKISFPALLKTRRFGYDGKGQFLITKQEDIKQAWLALGNNELILEQFIHFSRELSILSVRDQQGHIKHYPMVENQHKHGILRISKSPIQAPGIEKLGQAYSEKILNYFDYTGLLAIEFFQQGETLIANEMAPRVHNSGHWTLEGAVTSQFENHLRAICGLPIGNTEANGFSMMWNCVGTEPCLKDVLAIPYAHFHSYQKQAKINRKLGHITLHCDNEAVLQRNFNLLLALTKTSPTQ